MSWLADPHIWASFATLLALEMVLGIDNLVFLALLAARLPPAAHDAPAHRPALALLGRLALLGSISWLAHLTAPRVHRRRPRPLVARPDPDRRRRLPAVQRHAARSTRGWKARGASDAQPRGARVHGTVAQIASLDIVFSLDSVITAVGIAEQIWVMVAAIVGAMA